VLQAGHTLCLTNQTSIKRLKNLEIKCLERDNTRVHLSLTRTNLRANEPTLLQYIKRFLKDSENERRNFWTLAAAAAKQQRPKRAPKTIKQLLEQCGTEGTHSILDIGRVSFTPTFGAVVPLSRQQLVGIFGTEQPTQDMVEKWSRQIDSLTLNLCTNVGVAFTLSCTKTRSQTRFILKAALGTESGYHDSFPIPGNGTNNGEL